MPPDLTARCAHAAYDLVGALTAVACLPLLPLWLPSGGATGLRQRLGDLRAAPDLARPVWIHAASVGETLAAAPLVAELRRRAPEIGVVMSATTVTGRAVAHREATPDFAMLLPLDVLGIVDRAVRRVRPRCLVLVETEIWPGLLRAVHGIGSPTVVVSGRMSARSLERYRWFGPLFRGAIGRIAAFGMQTSEDAHRLLQLGADPSRVRVTGSLKAARTGTPGSHPILSGLRSRPLLIAASTQPGEEEFVLDSLTTLWSHHPDLLVLLAPRRPERFTAVEQLVAARGVRYELRSRIDGSVAPTTQIVLLDSVGELDHCFAAARAVFVGGSVAPLGGHNVLEPASHGKPVAFGPHTENVADAVARLTRLGCGRLVRQPRQLAAFWEEMLSDGADLERIAAAARLAACAEGPVLERTWELLAPYIGEGT